jgi:hypothetical protein
MFAQPHHEIQHHTMRAIVVHSNDVDTVDAATELVARVREKSDGHRTSFPIPCGRQQHQTNASRLSGGTTKAGKGAK